MATSFAVLLLVSWIPSSPQHAFATGPPPLLSSVVHTRQPVPTPAPAASAHDAQAPLPSAPSGGVRIPADQRIEAPETLAHGAMTLWPAPPSFDPGVSQYVATQEWIETVGPFTGSDSFTRPSTTRFGLLSAATTMATIEPEGKIRSNYVGSPVWVVETRHVPVGVDGGFSPTQRTGQPAPQTAISTCFTFINAMTGTYEFASCTGSAHGESTRH